MKRFLAIFALTTSEQRVVVILVLALVTAALLERCERRENTRPAVEQR